MFHFIQLQIAKKWLCVVLYNVCNYVALTQCVHLNFFRILSVFFWVKKAPKCCHCQSEPAFVDRMRANGCVGVSV